MRGLKLIKTKKIQFHTNIFTVYFHSPGSVHWHTFHPTPCCKLCHQVHAQSCSRSCDPGLNSSVHRGWILRGNTFSQRLINLIWKRKRDLCQQWSEEQVRGKNRQETTRAVRWKINGTRLDYKASSKHGSHDRMENMETNITVSEIQVEKYKTLCL